MYVWVMDCAKHDALIWLASLYIYASTFCCLLFVPAHADSNQLAQVLACSHGI